MTQNLTNFLKEAQHKERATTTGTLSHAVLQHIIVDTNHTFGDPKFIQTIQNRPDLQPFFTTNAQTEVPIAGNINGRFISRRIDRLLVNKLTKTIDFVDYKTDTTKIAYIDKYKKQLQEYAQLLHSAYPDYKINGYILWLHNWQLDKII